MNTRDGGLAKSSDVKRMNTRDGGLAKHAAICPKGIDWENAKIVAKEQKWTHFGMTHIAGS